MSANHPVSQTGFISAIAAFNPLSLSPAQWFDFSDIGSLFQDTGRTTPVTANNDPVGGVADKSTNGIHASQSTAASKPLFKTNVQNGLSALLFDGVNDFLSHSLSVPSNAQTIFAVVSALTQTGAREIYASDSNKVMMFSRNATSPNWGTYGTAERPSGTDIQGDGWAVLCIQRPASGDGFFWTNNVLDGSFADSLGGSKNIGGANGYNRNFGGHIGEILAFNTTLSNENLAIVNKYLGAKWGVNFP